MSKRTASDTITGVNFKRPRKKRHPGREQVFRERFQLERYWEQAEPSRDKHISEVVGQAISNIGLGRVHWLHTLEQEWADVVGEHLAGHTRPGPFEFGILTIFVDHPIRLAEMKRYGEKEITAKLQAKYPDKKFRKVRLSIDPTKR